MEDIKLDLLDKIEEYNILSSYQGKVMPDPYHQYDELQLGFESLNPILIRPDIPNINYNDLVQAELKVGLEGILRKIYEYFLKMVKWIRDKIVGGVRWLINANDDISREVIEIKKNTPSEIHNQLIRANNELTTLGKDFDDEFTKLIMGYTIADDIQLSKLKNATIKRLLDKVNVKLPTEEELSKLKAFKNELMDNVNLFLDNIIVGSISHSQYMIKQRETLYNFGGFNDDLILEKKGIFTINGEVAFSLYRQLKLVKGRIKLGQNYIDCWVFTAKGEQEVTLPPHSKLTETNQLTLGDLLDVKDYAGDPPVKVDLKVPDNKVLDIQVPDEDILANNTYHNNDNFLLIKAKASNETSEKHTTLLSDYVTFLSTMISDIDEILVNRVNAIKIVYKDIKTITVELNKEYEKSLKLANRMLDAINE